MQTATTEHCALEALRGLLTNIFLHIPGLCRRADRRTLGGDHNNSPTRRNLVLHLSVNASLLRAASEALETSAIACESRRGSISKEQLLATFDETIGQAAQTLQAFDTSRLLDTTDEQDYVPTVFDAIFNISIHLATHAGQIVYVTKMLKEGSLDELWIRAHKGN